MVQKLLPDIFLQRSVEGVVVDVRTPAEFASGHIPGAYNIPLFTNEERAEVGTLYVRVGKEQAVHRGLELVGPRLAWIVSEAKKIASGRPIYLYCWRGGMRSGSVAWLLETAGMKVFLLEGGYKSYRRSFEQLLQQHPWKFIMLSGSTGCGKTELLTRIESLGCHVLDIEGLACHKGSAFGALGQQPQPTTEHFINLLHERFRTFDPTLPVWCEGESMLVGHVFIPQYLFGILRSGLVVKVDMDRQQRLDRLMVEYGCFSHEELTEAFVRIKKRMGYDKAQRAMELVAEDDIRGAASLALDYYDQAYARSSGEQPGALTFTASNDDMAGSATRLVTLLKGAAWK